MSDCVQWIFGRGISIGCNLKWSVPPEFSSYSRIEKIERVKATLREEMLSSDIDASSISKFLSNLQSRTVEGWSNRFITTNWDTLLEKEIAALNLQSRPHWLASSYVYHLNGTIEVHATTKYQSPFLLEEDGYSQRTSTLEANEIFNFLAWSRIFVVVGMSFECESDRFLLGSLKKVEDEMPIGESTWIVLNPDLTALQSSSSRIKAALPRSNVYTKQISFNDWVIQGMAGLKQLGVFSF